MDCGSIIDLVGLVIAVPGVVLALLQWKKGNDYKRAEIVQNLILKVRDEEDISGVMTLVDWSKIEYDGKFKITDDCEDEYFRKIDDDKLFRMVDKTLSHFSYICYLKKRRCLSSKDMYGFEYELRRLVANHSIANYLYSLYHWSKSQNSNCTFYYLIDYSLENDLLDGNDFIKVSGRSKYKCFLLLPKDYGV